MRTSSWCTAQGAGGARGWFHRQEDRKGGERRSLWSGPFTLTCQCGHLEQRKPNFLWGREAVDIVFRLPLWLVTPCRGRTLWVYNGRQLGDLESYIAATHRPRVVVNGQRVNRSYLARLPGWMLAASARDDVLAAVARLRAKLVA